MSRFMLRVAYDGTGYCGFQVQPMRPTIEGELNKALSSLFAKEIEVIGASRTDAGVHALCNLAVFDADTTIPAAKIPYALNPLLPKDIVTTGCREVEEDFHPRHCASKKTYEYRIFTGEFPNPKERNYVWHLPYLLDVGAMREAAGVLLGEHDFKSFCCVKTSAESTVRTIYALDVEQNEKEIIIRVCGNGFLYNMVRIIAGTLAEVGKGRFTKEDVREILSAKDRTMAGPTAPAEGLTLIQYDFGGEEKWD